MDFGLRKTYRANLTKLANSVGDVVNSEDINVNEVSVLIERIKSLNVNLNSVNERLFSAFSEEQIDSECEKIAEYQDLTVQAVARLEHRLKLEYEVTQKRNIESQETRAAFSANTLGNNTDGYSKNTGNLSVRLPKLELCGFNGDIATWPAFWEQFKLAVHDNTALNDAAKLAYLKTYLSGKAAVTISGLTSSQSSYQDAIELLTGEYANSERILDSYIQKLLSIPAVKNERDIFSLRKLYNTAATIVRSFKTLGLSTDQYGLLVKSIFFKALPYNMRIAFNKHKLSYNDAASNAGSGSGEDYSTQIDNLLQFLKIELDSIEQAQCGAGQDLQNSDKFTKNKQTFKRYYKYVDKSKGSNESFTAVGLLSFAKNGCLFCKVENHQSADCNSSMNISQRKAILKQNGSCFKCTRPSHISKNCRVRIFCKRCKRKHASSMIDPRPANENTNDDIATSSRQHLTDNITTLLSNGHNNVYLKTACCFIMSKNNPSLKIRLVIDGGSQLTFIKQDISRSLELPIVGDHKISINGFGTSHSTPATLFNRVQLKLKSRHNNELIDISAIEVPQICFDSLQPPTLKSSIIREFSSRYSLADANVAEADIVGITLLIGADNYWKIVTGNTKRLAKELVAVDTKFGWTLHGSQANTDNNDFFVNFNLATVLNIQTNEDSVGNFDVKNFWKLETLGISANETSTNDFTETFIRDNIDFKNGRYEVLLPWKSDMKLDSNYPGALARVKSLVSKLYRLGKLTEYDNAVREYMLKDCAELVTFETDNQRSYFMPHRPVFREDKDTTKVRVVFDASAHSIGCSSLNEQLLIGDNLVPDVLKVLVNFRIGSVGLIADIEKAFLQIALGDKDRDSHLFLWFEEPIGNSVRNLSKLPNIVTYRMKRVTFGVYSSPFILSATLRKYLSIQTGEYKDVATLLSGSFYVDDLILSVSSLEEAVKIYEQSKQIMSSAKMNLRKWHSNDSRMFQHFKEEDKLPDESQRRKVLGVVWHSFSDELSVDLTSLSDLSTNIASKRSVLQTIAKIFDPLGILGPFTVRGKILLQRIWKAKLGWDVDLPPDLKEIWLKWSLEISTLVDMQIGRCAIDNKTNDVELHIFADASTQAYGTVAYIKSMVDNKIALLLAKNRVAPLNDKGNKELTLPRLKLTAALCAARLQCFIMEHSNFNLAQITFWSDSKIALYWIKGKASKWKPYVQNRVNEIQRISKGQWRYCPGRENPADLLTRGVSAKFLLESRFWQQGPGWLKSNSENWPSDEFHDVISDRELIR